MNRYLQQYLKPTIPKLTRSQKKFDVLQKIRGVKESNEMQEKENEIYKQYMKINKQITVFDKEGYQMVTYREVGEEKEKNEESVMRDLGKQTAQQMIKNKISSFDLQFSPELQNQHIGKFINSLILNNYKFQHKSKEEPFHSIQHINLIQEEQEQDNNYLWENISREIALGESGLYNRALINMRGNTGTTEYLQEECEKIVREQQGNRQLDIECIVGKELAERGMDLIYNVGRGSKQLPRMVLVEYRGNPNSSECIGLVGKGVVFDAGGLNIKTGGNMTDMHLDKGGACAMISAFRKVVEMGLEVNCVLGVGLVENLLGDDCYRQMDILSSYAGLTVEVGNTDAEGRLVLADVMAYMQQKYPQVDQLVEMSTLTGACLVALGEHQAGLFTNCHVLRDSLVASGQAVDEQVWPLPITQEHRNAIKGKQADIVNTGSSRYGGSSTAAAFLESFVNPGVKWAHIDIAGPAMVKVNDSASGFGSQLILDYLMKEEKRMKEQQQQN